MSKKLILGALLGGLVVFVWSAISWMAIPWHESTWRQFQDKNAITQEKLQ
jgi:hypothetical protein